MQTTERLPANERFWRERHFPVADETLFKILASAPAQQNPSERLLLFTLVRALSPQIAVEVGSFQGGSALVIATAMDYAGHGHLWCIEPRPQWKIDWSKISHRCTLVEQTSPEGFEAVAAQIPMPIEFAFIDAIHAYEPVVADTQAVLPLLAGSAWILYHDAMNDGVRRAIDFVVASDPRLSDCGVLCRYFNNDLWPQELMGGMRLLHFHDPSRSNWVPATASRPSDDSYPVPFSPEATVAARSSIDQLVTKGRTPIALYGSALDFTATITAIGDFGDQIACVFDDDPLMHGSVCLGWPIVDPSEHAKYKIKGVYCTEPQSEETKRRLAELESQGLAVVRSELPPVKAAAKVFDKQSQLMEKLKGILYKYGARRVALYGAGEFTRSLGARLARTFGRFLISAVVDDDPKLQGKKLWGVPIVSLEELVAMKPPVQWLVLSSPKHERALWNRRGPALAAKIPVVPVFESFDDKGDIPT